MRIGANTFGPVRMIVVGTVISLTAVACADSVEQSPQASPSPIYYVDGARPSPGADGDTGEGCVKWSEERSDVLICGPVTDSYEPPPAPGDYSDYPAVCDEAAQIFDEQVKDLVSTHELSTPPQIDIESCGAAGVGSAREGRWLARFSVANPEDVTPYTSVEIPNFTLDGGGKRYATLTEKPWPAE